MSGRPRTGGTGASSDVTRVVIDTNAWLDLLVFDDPRARALARALDRGTLLVVRSAACDHELDSVLARPAIAARRDAAAVQAALARWRAAALAFDAPPRAPLACRDPSDQKFLDLALASRAGYLVTKDRALLDLARKAGARDLRIVPPAAFDSPLSEGGVLRSGTFPLMTPHDARTWVRG